jgi:hypothetical protein
MVHSLVFSGLAIRRESQYGQDITMFPEEKFSIGKECNKMKVNDQKVTYVRQHTDREGGR